MPTSVVDARRGAQAVDRTRHVSYFDVFLGTGYDFVGQMLPEADDPQIQFTMLGDERLAAYEFSPLGQDGSVAVLRGGRDHPRSNRRGQIDLTASVRSSRSPRLFRRSPFRRVEICVAPASRPTSFA